MEIGLLPISASWLEFAVGIDPTHWIDRQNLNERAAGFALDTAKQCKSR